MALSNIFREPRREITETLIGLGVVLAIVTPLGLLDYWFAVWFYGVTGGQHGGCPVPIGAIYGILFAGIGIVGTMVLAMAIHSLGEAVHSFGENVCDWLEEKGIRLRPRRVPRTIWESAEERSRFLQEWAELTTARDEQDHQRAIENLNQLLASGNFGGLMECRVINSEDWFTRDKR